jgi:hypothetical protein
VREEEAYDCGTIRRGECAKSEKVDQQIHVSQLASGSRWLVVTSYQRSSDRDAESASLINPINLQRLRATALGDRSEDDGDHEVSPTATTRIESDPACRRNFVLLDLLLLRCRWAGFTATLRLIACHPPLMIRDPCAWATRWIDQRGEASRRGTGLGCHSGDRFDGLCPVWEWLVACRITWAIHASTFLSGGFRAGVLWKRASFQQQATGEGPEGSVRRSAFHRPIREQIVSAVVDRGVFDNLNPCMFDMTAFWAPISRISGLWPLEQCETYGLTTCLSHHAWSCMDLAPLLLARSLTL